MGGRGGPKILKNRSRSGLESKKSSIITQHYVTKRLPEGIWDRFGPEMAWEGFLRQVKKFVGGWRGRLGGGIKGGLYLYFLFITRNRAKDLSIAPLTHTYAKAPDVNLNAPRIPPSRVR